MYPPSGAINAEKQLSSLIPPKFFIQISDSCPKTTNVKDKRKTKTSKINNDFNLFVESMILESMILNMRYSLFKI